MKPLITLFLFIISVNAIAVGQATSTIRSVNVMEGYVEIKLTDGIPSSGCAQGNAAYLDSSASSEFTSHTLSLALAAYMAGKVVDLTVDGCTSFGYPKITALQIENK